MVPKNGAGHKDKKVVPIRSVRRFSKKWSRSRARRNELVYTMKRMDGEDLTPRDIAHGLSDQLHMLSAHQKGKGYFSTHMRIPITRFNWIGWSSSPG